LSFLASELICFQLAWLALAMSKIFCPALSWAGDVLHFGAARGQLKCQEQSPIIQVQTLAVFHQVKAADFQHVGHGAIDDASHVCVDGNRGDFLYLRGGFLLIIGKDRDRQGSAMAQRKKQERMVTVLMGVLLFKLQFNSDVELQNPAHG
jgi:hypothetical protein